MLDTGCWLLDTSCRLQVAGYRLEILKTRNQSFAFELSFPSTKASKSFKIFNNIITGRGKIHLLFVCERLRTGPSILLMTFHPQRHLPIACCLLASA